MTAATARKPRPVYTPWNPSPKAIAKVSNPLPVPDACPHCSSPVKIVDNAEIYGRRYGEWPWAVLCTGVRCGAYVGLHPKTGIPLGTLATKPMRDARREAKRWFAPLYDGPQATMTRSEAYAWLAKAMGIENIEHCHVGWFDIAQCAAVVAAVKARAAS